MSSLAGALDLPNQARPSTGRSDDIEMISTPQSSALSQDEEEDQDEAMSDLFGNDNDVEEQRRARPAPASPDGSGPDSERLPSPERERRQALEYEEEEVPPEMAIEVKEAEVKFPNLPVPKPSDGNNWVIRVPNYVKVDSKPFHPDTYVGPEHEEEELGHGDSGRETSMSIKLKVEEHAPVKESNSRVIRWSDGTLSLRLGKELFDISHIPRQTLGVERQSSKPRPKPSLNHNPHQASPQPRASPRASPISSRNTNGRRYSTCARPACQSETHRMLVRAVEQKHKQIARLRIAPEPTEDPERAKLELIKKSAKKPKTKKDDADGLPGGRSAAHIAGSAPEIAMRRTKLERMEANLEKQAAAEKKGRGHEPKKSKKAAREEDEETEDEGAGAMDVESEEEDGEEFRVRRVTSKRALALEEEDDE
ncbi:Leo1-like protein-domain-containing protein [Pholiota molesta]|nr:Leo1-like protein-domain-containing protein [Pholiota molesta]